MRATIEPPQQCGGVPPTRYDSGAGTEAVAITLRRRDVDALLRRVDTRGTITNGASGMRAELPVAIRLQGG